MNPKAKSQINAVICVDNDGYAASLETRKIYLTVPDAGGEKQNLIRVIDESGESYLYPKAMFRSISLPAPIKEALSLTPGKRTRVKKASIKKSKAA